MVEIVQIVEDYSLAYARMDIPVTAAKLVNIIFKNVPDVCLSLSHLYSGNNFVEVYFITNSASSC
jgi:hypothetical protein